MKETIAKNLRDLHGQIADACEEYGRDTDDVTIVAISKTFPTTAMQIVVAAGIHNIGESRLQHAEPKLLELGPIARYHMVGHLQTNKVAKAVELFDVIQSVDSLKLANEINRQAAKINRKIECLVQVNITGQSQQGGIPPSECLSLLEQIGSLPNIELTGLMAIGPNTDDEEAIRTAFRECRQLYKGGRKLIGQQFDTLSLGMTHDFPLAIAEGSTMIRIGTGLFGPR